MFSSSDGVLSYRVMLNRLIFLRFFRDLVVNTCLGKLRFIWCSDPFSDAISRLFLFMLILSINKDLCLNLSFLASYILLLCVFNPANKFNYWLICDFNRWLWFPLFAHSDGLWCLLGRLAIASESGCLIFKFSGPVWPVQILWITSFGFLNLWSCNACITLCAIYGGL